MKTAISNIAWPAEHDEMVASLMQEFGVRGVEIAPTRNWSDPLQVTDAEVAACRGFWKEYDVEIVSMQALLFGRADLLLFESESSRSRMLDYLDGIMELAGRLGAGPLVFGSPGNRQRDALSIDEALDIATVFFRDAAVHAESHGVVLCIEPNPPQYNCDFITNAADALELVERVNHPGFGLHLDAAAMLMAGDLIADTVRRCAAEIRHVHASEPQLGALGEGGVNHREFADALCEAGYSGYVSVEMRHDPARDTRSEMRRVLGYLRDVYAD